MRFSTLDKTFIIAEIGVNHEGSEDVAADLIRKAAASGADAVKFQTYKAEGYVSAEQPERLERVKRFELSYEAFRRLAKLAEELGVVFFSTPLADGDVDFLDTIAPMYKISSGDMTWLDLIRHVASKQKPVILSTGLCTEEEVEAAVNVVLSEQPNARENGSLMLMHCVSAYPTPPEQANLRNFHWLRERFNLPVGYSDHTSGSKACELAVAMGAVSVEKHFTYRKEDQDFHDHALSADPKDMKEMVEAIRQAEVYLGRVERLRAEAELPLEQHMRRSLAAAQDIELGTELSRDMVTFLRPAWGIGANDAEKAYGRRLNKAISAGALIREEDLN